MRHTAGLDAHAPGVQPKTDAESLERAFFGAPEQGQEQGECSGGGVFAMSACSSAVIVAAQVAGSC